MAKVRLTLLLMTLCLVIIAQKSYAQWKNKKCAVVLTYDDALNAHLDHAIPALDSLGLKGTFYLSAYFPGCKERIADWKKAGANGHELANHTLFHPCISSGPGRSWVTPERALEKYSLQRLLDEIRMTNVFLEALDGKTERTFAYPCGDTMVGDISYMDKIEKDFIAARGVKSEMYSAEDADLYNIGSYMINGESGEELIALVKEAMKENKLLVFLFHGVGGEHGLNVELKAHNQLLNYLKQNEKNIWNATMIDIAKYVKDEYSASK